MNKLTITNMLNKNKENNFNEDEKKRILYNITHDLRFTI